MNFIYRGAAAQRSSGGCATFDHEISICARTSTDKVSFLNRALYSVKKMGIRCIVRRGMQFLGVD